LMDQPVFDKEGELVGEFYDIAVKPTEVYPQSALLVICKGFINRKYGVIVWHDIQEMEEKAIRLKIEKGKITFREKHNNKEELTLRRDILDQQVVDTANHKVIRVNDIHLLRVDHSLMIAHVDISMRGLIRRLGFEQAVDFLMKICFPNSDYLRTEHLISWKHIQPLSINPVSMTIKVNFPSKQLNSIPAADLGEIFLDLNMQHQLILFKSLDLNTRARIFMNIDFKAQASLVEELDQKEVVEMLMHLPTDEATDFLEKLPRDLTERFLALMESKQSKKLSELLGYSSDSAGGLMTTEYLAFTKDTLVGSVLSQIKERIFKVEPAQFVFIVDEEHHLVGTTNFRHLILADPNVALVSAAFPKAYSVHLDSSVKEIAYLMEKYKYYVIPVIDNKHILKGIVTLDDVLSQVISIAWRRLTKIKVKQHKI
ncbi:MAG: CBS domain-containing protein, partial [Candidatus Omnitrophica bacterium]|nr:CBS domain-containing protein [Candidatus Omnitrophota bacterium]